MTEDNNDVLDYDNDIDDEDNDDNNADTTSVVVANSDN
jgi:hypothetical protein